MVLLTELLHPQFPNTIRILNPSVAVKNNIPVSQFNFFLVRKEFLRVDQEQPVFIGRDNDALSVFNWISNIIGCRGKGRTLLSSFKLKVNANQSGSRSADVLDRHPGHSSIFIPKREVARELKGFTEKGSFETLDQRNLSLRSAHLLFKNEQLSPENQALHRTYENSEARDHPFPDFGPRFTVSLLLFFGGFGLGCWASVGLDMKRHRLRAYLWGLASFIQLTGGVVLWSTAEPRLLDWIW
jgi:hypothetical protein